MEQQTIFHPGQTVLVKVDINYKNIKDNFNHIEKTDLSLAVRVLIPPNLFTKYSYLDNDAVIEVPDIIPAFWYLDSQYSQEEIAKINLPNISKSKAWRVETRAIMLKTPKCNYCSICLEV